jgi:hypothetical protein
MAYKEGIIETISIKERRTGNYGDFAGFSIKVDGVWYSAGLASADKNTNELIPRDKDKKPLTQGMKVDFKYTTNDKGYHEVEKGSLAILGAQQAPPPTQEHPAQQPIRTAPPITEEPVNASFMTQTLWNDCVRSAVLLAKSTTFQCGDKAPEQFTSEQVMRVAQRFFDEMQKK